jgi:hypothetical protein
MENKQSELYQFLAQNRSRRQTYRTVWAFNIALALLMFGLGGIVVRQWIANRGTIQQPDTLIVLTLAGLLYFILRAIQSAAAGYVTSSDIAINSEGVQIFLHESSPRLIAWDAFTSATITPVKPLTLFRAPRDDESTYAVQVSSLGLPFRLAGLSYGQGWHPIFVVTPDHELFARLLDQLKQHQADQADHL